MASRYRLASAALVFSALAGLGAYQAQAGVLGLNLQLLAPWQKFGSSADAVCAPLWVKEAQNDPALKCYLTENAARLCDPRERLHLAYIMRAYRWDAAMLTANTFIAVVKPATMPVATPQKLQQAQNELTGSMNGASGERHGMTALREITEKRIDNIVKARPATLDAALDVDMLAPDELSAPLRHIARTGLMQKGEFGWWPGRLVDEAFEGVAAARACKDISRAR
jgi:hypothetical protein